MTPQQIRYIDNATPLQCQWLWGAMRIKYFPGYFGKALSEKYHEAGLPSLGSYEIKKHHPHYPRGPKTDTADALTACIASLL